MLIDRIIDLNVCSEASRVCPADPGYAFLGRQMSRISPFTHPLTSDETPSNVSRLIKKISHRQQNITKISQCWVIIFINRRRIIWWKWTNLTTYIVVCSNGTMCLSTRWSKKARPVHIFAYIFQTPWPNAIISGTLKQHFGARPVPPFQNHGPNFADDLRTS